MASMPFFRVIYRPAGVRPQAASASSGSGHQMLVTWFEARIGCDDGYGERALPNGLALPGEG